MILTELLNPETPMVAKFLDIPITDVILENWAGMRPNLRLLKSTVVAYFHTTWCRPKSSARNDYSCLVLAVFSEGETKTYLLAPMYRRGNNQRWGASDMACGDRLNPPLPDFRFFSSPPSADEVHALIAQIGFFYVGSETKVIESFGADPVLNFPGMSLCDDSI
jgi:hypothetical protein